MNAVFADGAVRFVSDTIHVKNMNVNAVGTGGAHIGTPGGADNWIPAVPIAANGNGDVAQGAPFSYGVWAELGSVNGGIPASL